MNAGVVSIIAGLTMVVGAGGAYIYLNEFRKTEARVETVVVKQEAAPAPKPEPIFPAPVPHVDIKPLAAVPTVTQLPAPAKKVIKPKRKKQPPAVSKLKSKWSKK